MSVYVLSDIHGKLSALKKMLDKIEFNKDDTIYLLGDFVDYGPESIELIKFLMNADDRFKCTLGNHDDMMLQSIGSLTKDEFYETVVFPYTRNWVIGNGGDQTASLFFDEEESVRSEIICWLGKLPLRYKISVGNNKFYLSHASVLHKDGEYNNEKINCIWERVDYPQSMDDYICDDFSFDEILVHGHTQTILLDEDNGNPYKIINDIANRRIAIDCCCKGLFYNTAARLGCIRLDDLREFYVSAKELGGF